MNPKKDKISQGQKALSEKRKSTLKKEIGVKIRQVRKSLGYTQDRMVDFFDCGRANYSRIEKGEVFPNPAMLNVFNSHFNVSLHWLVCGKGEMLEHDEKQGDINPPAKGSDAAEIQDLLDYIEGVPMVKHAVLSYFLEYLEKNKKLIAPFLKQPKAERN